MTALDLRFVNHPRPYQVGDLVRRTSRTGFKLAVVVGFASNDARVVIRHYRANRKKWSNLELEYPRKLYPLDHEELTCRMRFIEVAVERMPEDGPPEVRLLAAVADSYPVYQPPTLVGPEEK